MLKGFLVEYETDIVHKKLLEFSSTARYGRIAKHQKIDIKKIQNKVIGNGTIV